MQEQERRAAFQEQELTQDQHELTRELAQELTQDHYSHCLRPADSRLVASKCRNIQRSLYKSSHVSVPFFTMPQMVGGPNLFSDRF